MIKREERFRNLSDSLPEIVFEANINGKLTYVNKRAFEISGYTEKDFAVGFTAFDFIHQKDKERAIGNFKKILINQPSTDNEYNFVRKDGSTFPIVILSKPIVEKNQIVGVRGILVDITERKKVEDATKKSSAMYQELTNSLPEIIFETDLTGKITFFSQQAIKATGFTEEEFKEGINLLSFVVPEERGKAMENLQKTLYRFEHSPGEYTLLRKNGTTYPAIVRTIPIVSNDKVIGVRGVALDITDRKKSEKEVQESEEKFRAIARSVKDAVILTDKNAKVVYWNPASEKIFGYSNSEVINKDLHELVVPKTICKEGKEYIINGVQKFAETGHGTIIDETIELVGRKKDGSEFSAKLSLTPIKLNDEWHAVGVVKDITERKHDEEERKVLERKLAQYSKHLKYLVDLRTIQLKDANERLIKSERLAAIGELAGMVGHDLRNPLAGMRNATYFLKKKGKTMSDDQFNDMLENIDTAICRSDKIINDLLDYAREMTLELTKYNAHQLTNEAIKLVNVPKHIKITNHVQEKTSVWVNADKMHRVFTNLIKNAIDSMSQNGTLSIDSHKTKDFLAINFTDTGSGIPDDVLPKLFTPLFTTKAQGMGFGLAICKRIVEAHRGNISVKTKVNKGTTFTITFPLKPKNNKEEIA